MTSIRPDLKRAIVIVLVLFGVVGVLFAQSAMAQATLDQAKSYHKQAIKLYRAGKTREAIPLAMRALSIREKALSPSHPDIALSLNDLAFLYEAQGHLAKAEPIYKRVLAIREKILPSGHPNIAAILNNLAHLYEKQGRFKDAEPLYKRALAMREKARPAGHLEIAQSLNNLAGLYNRQDRNAEAEPLYKRALEIREKAFPDGHPSVAEGLNNLAFLYQSVGRFREAEPLYKRAQKMAEKILPVGHPHIAYSLNNLALLYRLQGRLSEAEPLFNRALALNEKTLSAGHPRIAVGLNNLASVYDAQGQLAKAETLYERALAMREKALPPGHPSIATGLNNLAFLYQKQQKWQAAHQLFVRGTDILIRRSRRSAVDTASARTAANGSTEATRRAGNLHGLIKVAHRLAAQFPERATALANESFTHGQWAKASKAAASIAQMAARGATDNPALARLVRERQDLTSQWQTADKALIAASARPPEHRNPSREQRQRDLLEDIDARLIEIDQRLRDGFPGYSALVQPEPLTIDGAQALLGANEALVVMLDTVKVAGTPDETFIWVVTKTARRWVRSEIGPKGLRDHVDALRCGLDYDGAWKGTRCFDVLNEIYSDQDRLAGAPLPFRLNRAHALYKLLFGQVEDLIRGKNLLIVPSGPLTQLPFQVLVTKKPADDQLTRNAFVNASWLMQHHSVTILPSVSSLQALRARSRIRKSRKPYIGFGNPLLDGNPQDQWQRAAAQQARSIKGCAGASVARSTRFRAARSPVMPLGRGMRLADLAQLRFQAPLPETADELCTVARSAGAGKEDIFLGQSATEAGIKMLSRSGVLAGYKVAHFATHGALAGELNGSNEPGLILSPPQLATPNDDGYLSASDIIGLKLDADWVILSACNTAAGSTTNAEALSGLANAFFYAGARSLLVSHWYVDSQATVELITRTFANLKRDLSIGRSEALRRAMLSLSRDSERVWHPAFWAPFIVVGDGGL